MLLACRVTPRQHVAVHAYRFGVCYRANIIVVTILVLTFELQAHCYLDSLFACLYTLVPCVFELSVASTSTFFEPISAATTTTLFARFFNASAFPAH